MAEQVTSSNLTQTVNYFLDNILGLDAASNLVQVVAAPSADKNGLIAIDLKFVLGSWPKELAEFISDFPGLKLFSIDVDPAKLTRDRNYAIEIEAQIKSRLDGFVEQYVGKAAEGISGVEHALAQTAAGALKDLLASKIVAPVSTLLSSSLLALDLPNRADVTKILGDAFDSLNSDYFKAFLPGISKTYAKLGLSEILTKVSSGASPAWSTAIHTVGAGVLAPMLDTIVDNYFKGGPLDTGVLDRVQLTKTLGNAFAGLLVDFEKLDKKLVDDILGIDGHGFLQTQIADLLNTGINNFVKQGFVDTLDFLSGDFDALDLGHLFDEFTGQFGISSIKSILSGFLAQYSGTKLAELFVDIDSLPEALVSQLGSTILSGALGKVLGTLGFDAVAGLFGEATASAIGAAIFNGLGTLLSAGVGAVLGSVVFEFIDGLFDGAISGFIGDIVEWFQNESPQAFYRASFHAETNRFEYVVGSAYHKDDDGSKILAAVTKMSQALQDKVNAVIAFVDQPATVDAAFDDITMVWGKKHFDKKFSAFLEGQEANKLILSSDAQAVVTTAIGAVLRHMDFHTGNATIARAYEQWKASIGAGSGDQAFVTTEAFNLLQNLVGLARFANDYRQDPTKFDALMASDAPVAVTILQQYLEAQARGYNDATVLHGSDLKLEEVGSAAAGDTIYLDGPAVRAIARGGGDTIYAGTAAAQYVDGGTGSDTLVLAKERSAYSVKVTDRAGLGAIITDLATGIKITVDNVETFRFNTTTLTFEQAFPNHAPLITSNGGGSAATALVSENATAVTTVVATDADSDLLRYAIMEGGDGALFAINVATGVLTFRTAPDYEAVADGNHDNVYELTVFATDGTAIDTQAISVRVTNVVENASEGNVAIGTGAADTIGNGSAPVGQPFTTARNDVVFANAGDDIVYGGDGNDRLVGGIGADTLGGDGGNDQLEGEDGDDKLYGGTGNDVLLGGNGKDLLLGDDGNDDLDGGADNDTLWGYRGDDKLQGGAGNDQLYGEADNDTLSGGAGTDTLIGGAGTDLFKDTAAGLNGDTVSDLSAGEAIQITDASLVGFKFSLAGSTLTYSGGSLTLQNLPSGYHLQASAAASGVALTLVQDAPTMRNNGLSGDFNGDGKSDLLWRSDAGQLSDWLGKTNGGFAANDANALAKVPTSWHVAGAGDFNGDGRDDILWRSDAGQLSDWLGKANGGFTPNDANALSGAPTSWHVAGTGDFNGDGRDDILWRSDSGQLSDWLAKANGGFTPNDANALSGVPTNWHVVGTGDFNGDGRDDILWRSDSGQLSNWLAKANGGFTPNDANAFSSVPTNWHVVGTGDFNGDGRDDILWRSDSGQLSNWLAKANGGFTPNDAAALRQVDTGWSVAGTGDFNGDGRDDIVWRSASGALSDWLAQAGGGFAPNDANAYTQVDTNWNIQVHDSFVI